MSWVVLLNECSYATSINTTIIYETKGWLMRLLEFNIFAEAPKFDKSKLAGVTPQGNSNTPKGNTNPPTEKTPKKATTNSRAAPNVGVAAAGNDLKAKYAAMVKTLKLEPGADEGFFGRNTRNNANNEILAQFAEDNNLPGVFNPETTRFIKFNDDDEADASDEIDDTGTPDFDELGKLADIGAIPAAVQDKLSQEVADYDSGDRSMGRNRGGIWSNIMGDPDPESRDKLLSVLKRNGQTPATDAPVKAAPVKAAPVKDTSYKGLLATLEKAPADEGFFSKGNRQSRNAELLAKFAEDNDLPGMYDPETGDFVYMGTDGNDDDFEYSGSVSPQVVGSADMGDAKKLAAAGMLPPIVMQRFTDQLANADPDDDMTKDMNDIFKANAAYKAANPASDKATPTKATPTKATPTKATPTKATPTKATPANPLATKPGDYTGADGVEDMSTGMFVKPGDDEAKPKAGDTPVQTGGPGGEFAGKPPASKVKATPPSSGRAKVAANASNTKDYARTLKLQQELIAGGANIKADGIMGPNTQRALDAETARRNNADGNKPADLPLALSKLTSMPLDRNMPVPTGTMPKIPARRDGDKTPPEKVTSRLPKVDLPTQSPMQKWTDELASLPKRPMVTARSGHAKRNQQDAQRKYDAANSTEVASNEGKAVNGKWIESSVSTKTAVVERIIENYILGKVSKEITVKALLETKSIHLLTETGIRKRLYKL
jgi:hypothetical protein